MERPVDIHRLQSLNGNETIGCGHADFAKPTLVLSAEHRVIERALEILERLARTPVQDSVPSWQKILDFFSHFADQCHHLKEEQVLFPAMEEHGIPREWRTAGASACSGRALAPSCWLSIGPRLTGRRGDGNRSHASLPLSSVAASAISAAV